MSKLKFILPLVVLFIFITSPLAFAQDTGLLIGQNHFYSVFFRGNGEAIVFGRITINNQNDRWLDEFSLEIPKVNPAEMVIFQQKVKEVCVEYDYSLQPDPLTLQYPCLRYQMEDMQSYPYFYAQSEYMRANYTASGNLFRMTLPEPIAPQKSGAIIFSYAAFGYVKNSLGLFKFNFETPKVPSRISSLKVSVDVDSELYLKGKRSEVNYTVPSQELFSPSGVSGGKFASPALDSLVSQIGSYGSMVKEAKNLAPNESLSVKGEYAKSKFRLYLWNYLLFVLIVAGILAGIFYLRKYLDKRKTAQAILPAVKKKAVAPKDNEVSILNFTYASTGLLSAMLVIVLTWIVKYLSTERYFYFMQDEFFGLIVLIVILLLYVLAIFGPAVYIGSKHGARAGISVLITELLWFVILLALYSFILKSGLMPSGIQPQPYPYPM